MTKEEVVEIMGMPDIDETFKKPDGSAFEFCYYYTHRTREDGNITKDECTPVVFEDNRMISLREGIYKLELLRKVYNY